MGHMFFEFQYIYIYICIALDEFNLHTIANFSCFKFGYEYFIRAFSLPKSVPKINLSALKKKKKHAIKIEKIKSGLCRDRPQLSNANKSF